MELHPQHFLIFIFEMQKYIYVLIYMYKQTHTHDPHQKINADHFLDIILYDLPGFQI